MYRQLEKYDGDVRSLALKPRLPKSHPNTHTTEEIRLIAKMPKRNGRYGLTEVYVRCKSAGYTRSFWSMCRQIRKKELIKPKKKHKKSYTKYNNITGTYPGEKVQVDIKYVPIECIKFPTYGKRYYQITAIDEYTRKRVLKIVQEKSTFETSIFLRELENKMGFKIKTIQVDNGYEFVNDPDKTNRKTAFEVTADAMKISIKRIRPYSPWQNGKVERSHREDGKILYSRETFTSLKMLIDKVSKHEKRYNKTAKQVLKFKSPNQVMLEFISQAA